MYAHCLPIPLYRVEAPSGTHCGVERFVKAILETENQIPQNRFGSVLKGDSTCRSLDEPQTKLTSPCRHGFVPSFGSL